MDKYDTLKHKIVKYLKDRKAYDSVDVTLIDELVFNMELCDKAKEDIRERGIQVDISKPSEDRVYMQVNQSVTIYNGALKMITAISTKLGLTVLDRTKLKLKAKEGKSELDKLLDD